MKFVQQNNTFVDREAMRIDASGNLLVGKTSESETVEGIALRSTGQARITSTNGQAAIVNRLGTDGVIQSWRNDNVTVAQVEGNGAYTGPISTAAMKHDIQDSSLGLSNILNIPVRSFRYNSDADVVVEAGFIAEELEQCVPQAVGSNKGRSDANLVPVLVKAIQELTARVEALGG
jgi:hypothetical protein